MVKFSKFCSESFHRDTIRHCCVHVITFVRWEIGEIGCYLVEKKQFCPSLKLSLMRRLCPKSASASPQQCTQSALDFIQIGSLLAEL